MPNPDFFYDNTRPARPVPGVDLSRPSAARMYNLMLGGTDNFEVDRSALDALLEQVPEMRDMALANRKWLGRVVRYLSESGIDQFLDIGSGLPSQNPTHQVAARHVPGREPRVVYVDYDPMVLSHARAILAEDPSTTTVVQGDLRDPAQILDHPDVNAFIDFNQPVALLLVAVLHFLPDDQHPHRVVQTLRDALPPGSYIAISHVDNAMAPQRAAFLQDYYTERGIPGQVRSPEQVTRFFHGTEPVDPGLGYIGSWRPDLTVTDPDPAGAPHPPPATGSDPAQAWVYGGLCRVP
ncbi:O-methyltransferase involved in polyketide biosynthesis [Murinocardiopsis flavida]|uniref:O-methyltransferase involved in polyketide biosynthesis n=1 Tax=Murinocardiopsis flavida TaxID=645275 RepID=A0A2P8DG84_9ACTN|nr:SAM-dependent methyltransferase [Murinocardiopsis flavida]PSK96209.1 O-methyltransferase involved in polyketide biosynthesis [Murinocardiopsis flavida]